MANRRSLLLLVLALAVLGAGLLLWRRVPSGPTSAAQGAAALIDGVPLSPEEIRAAAASLEGFSAADAGQRTAAVRRAVEQRWLAGLSSADGGTAEPDDSTWPLLYEAGRLALVGGRAPAEFLSPQAFQAYLDAHRAELRDGDDVAATLARFEDATAALAAKQALSKGGTLAAFFKKPPTGATLVTLDFSSPADLVDADLRRAIWRSPQGAVSGPVRVHQAYYLVEPRERRSTGARSEEDIRSRLYADLSQFAFEKSFAEALDKLVEPFPLQANDALIRQLEAGALPEGDPVVARVKDRQLSALELLGAPPGSGVSPGITPLRARVDAWARIQRVIAHAQAEKLPDEPRLAAALTASRQAGAVERTRRELQARAEAAPSALQRELEALRQGPAAAAPEVKLQLLLVRSQRLADGAARRLALGATLPELHGYTVAAGGIVDVGWFWPAELPGALGAAVAAAAPLAVVGPVETPEGWAIARVLERRAEAPAAAELESLASARARKAAAAERERQLLDERWKTARLVVDEAALAALWNGATAPLASPPLGLLGRADQPP